MREVELRGRYLLDQSPADLDHTRQTIAAHTQRPSGDGRVEKTGGVHPFDVDGIAPHDPGQQRAESTLVRSGPASLRVPVELTMIQPCSSAPASEIFAAMVARPRGSSASGTECFFAESSESDE